MSCRRNFVRCFVALLSVSFSPALAAGQEPKKDTAPKSLASYADLLDLLDHDSVTHKANKEQSYVGIPTRRKDLQGSMLIRWMAKEGVVQFIQTLPMEFASDRVPAMETAMTHLNHALAFGGLAMDYQNLMPYYRFAVPIEPRGSLQADELRTYMAATLKQAAELYMPLKQIAEQGAEPLEVINALRRDAEQRKAAVKSPRPTT